MTFPFMLKNQIFESLAIKILYNHQVVTFFGSWTILKIIMRILSFDSKLTCHVNLGKIQFIILENKSHDRYSLNIRSITIKESDETELIWTAFDQTITFTKHIEDLCRVLNYRLNALRRIRQYLSLQKAETLGNVFISSSFHYVLVIWEEENLSESS